MGRYWVDVGLEVELNKVCNWFKVGLIEVRLMKVLAWIEVKFVLA